MEGILLDQMSDIEGEGEQNNRPEYIVKPDASGAIHADPPPVIRNFRAATARMKRARSR